MNKESAVDVAFRVGTYALRAHFLWLFEQGSPERAPDVLKEHIDADSFKSENAVFAITGQLVANASRVLGRIQGDLVGSPHLRPLAQMELLIQRKHGDIVELTMTVRAWRAERPWSGQVAAQRKAHDSLLENVGNLGLRDDGMVVAGGMVFSNAAQQLEHQRLTVAIASGNINTVLQTLVDAAFTVGVVAPEPPR